MLALYFTKLAITIKFNLFDPGYFTIDFIIPFIASGIYVLFYLRAQLKETKFIEKERTFILFITVVAISVSALLTQMYTEEKAAS